MHDRDNSNLHSGTDHDVFARGTEEACASYERTESNEFSNNHGNGGFLTRDKTSHKSGRNYTREDAYYKCSLCPFKTRHGTVMRRHRNRHKDPTFSCQECNMPFFSKGHLRGHCRSAHGTEITGYDTVKELERLRTARPVVKHCDVCDYATVNKGDLEKHKRLHRFGTVECTLCKRPVNKIEVYRAHLLRVHDIKLDPKDSLNIENKALWEMLKKQKSKIAQTEVRKRKAPHPTNNMTYKEGAIQNCASGKILTKSKFKRRTHSSATKTEGNKNNKAVQEFDARSIENRGQGDVKKTNLVEASHNIECVFCDFVAHSYKSLIDHLDTHDFDASNVGEQNKSLNEITNETSGLIDCSSLEEFFASLNTDISDSEAKSHNSTNLDKSDITSITCEMETKTVGEDPCAENQFADLTENIEDSTTTFCNSTFQHIDRGQSTQHHRQTKKHFKGYSSSPRYGMVTAQHQIDKDTDESSIQTNITYLKTNNEVYIQQRNDKEKENTDISVKTRSHDGYRNGTQQQENNLTCMKQSVSAKVQDIQLLVAPFACALCDFRAYALKHLKEQIKLLGDTNVITEDSGILKPNKTDTEIRFPVLNSVQITSTPVSNSKATQTEEANLVADKSDAVVQTSVTKITDFDTQEYFQQRKCILKYTNNNVVTNTNRSKDKVWTGRLSRKEFKRTRKFYNQIDETCCECLICDSDNVFETTRSAREHFKACHWNLRCRVCDTCSYCSKPFP